MKILGQTSIRPRSKTVDLGAIKLEVHPISYGMLAKILAELPRPMAPGGSVMMGKNGKPIKDSKGQPRVHRDTTDPGYLRSLKRWSVAQGVALTIASLRGALTDIRPQRADEDGIGYYLALLDDFHEAGIDQGMMGMLGQASSELSEALSDEEVAAAREALGQEEEDEEGNA